MEYAGVGDAEKKVGNIPGLFAPAWGKENRWELDSGVSDSAYGSAKWPRKRTVFLSLCKNLNPIAVKGERCGVNDESFVLLKKPLILYKVCLVLRNKHSCPVGESF